MLEITDQCTQCAVPVFQILFIACGAEHGKPEIGHPRIVVSPVLALEVYGGIGCVVRFLDVADRKIRSWFRHPLIFCRKYVGIVEPAESP